MQKNPSLICRTHMLFFCSGLTTSQFLDKCSDKSIQRYTSAILTMLSVLTHSSISSCCSLITMQHSGIQFVSRYLTVVSFDNFTCETKSSRVSGIASRKSSMSNKRTAKYLENFQYNTTNLQCLKEEKSIPSS